MSEDKVASEGAQVQAGAFTAMDALENAGWTTSQSTITYIDSRTLSRTRIISRSGRQEMQSSKADMTMIKNASNSPPPREQETPNHALVAIQCSFKNQCLHLHCLFVLFHTWDLLPCIPGNARQQPLLKYKDLLNCHVSIGAQGYVILKSTVGVNCY